VIGFEQRFVIFGLEKKLILRTAEQMWVVRMFADGNKWEAKQIIVLEVDEKNNCKKIISIKDVPREMNTERVEGFVLFDAGGCSLPSHKLGYNEPELPVTRWYVNSVPKTTELIRNPNWWNGNPPATAIPAVWSRESGVKVLGDSILIEELRVRLRKRC